MTVPLETIRRAPKVLLHDHLDGGLRPAHDRRAGGRDRLRRAADHRRRRAGRLDPTRRRPQVARALPRDLRPHGGGDADARRRSPGSPPSAPRTWPPTGSSTPRSAMRRSSRRPAACPSTPWSRRSATGSGPGTERAAEAGRPIIVRQLVTAMRQADRALEIAELALRHRDEGVVGFDIAGPEAGLPARSLRRGVPPPDPCQLPPDPPRRRGLRPAVDPGGDRPRGRAARATASGSSTTSRSSRAATPGWDGWRPTSAIGASRSSCARPRTSTPGWRTRSPTTRSTCSGGCASGSP